VEYLKKKWNLNFFCTKNIEIIIRFKLKFDVVKAVNVSKLKIKQTYIEKLEAIEIA